MNQQLIITILGADQFGVLSNLAEIVSNAGCNILDSRQATYGQDFSLTMIIEGSPSAIVRAECLIPQTCQKHNLLSLMKRTSAHNKQNLENLADIIIRGQSTPGLIDTLTKFFAIYRISVSAFRLKFVESEDAQISNQIKCKMVISIPHELQAEEIERAFHTLLAPLNLQGEFRQNH